jgi:hypothetical protein
MAKLLFKMYGVPDDEVQAIRELCEEQNFDIYETQMGRWGVGLSAIWLRDNDQYDAACAAIDVYQQSRLADAKLSREAIQNLSLLQGFYVKLKQDPKQFLLSLVSVGIVLCFMIYPFIGSL